MVPDLGRSVVVTSTPWWLPVVKELPAAVRCYDYLDHVEVQAGPSRIEAFQKWDDELLGLSRLVTTVSEPLRRQLATRCSADVVHLLPNGVCSEWIESSPLPANRRSLTPRPEKPIAGFLGAVFEWVDVELIAEVSRRLPDMEFVIVGPTRRGLSINRLRALPNIRCHDPVPFEKVPAIVGAFDVCLIPFKRNLISEYADPLKVYEYCALGKPVVSTVLFNAGGPEPPISVAATPDAFAGAIRASLAEPLSERKRRIDFARRHTWRSRAERFVALTATSIQR